MPLFSSAVADPRVRFWQAHARALAGSGLSRCAYSRQHQLSYHALTYWVRKFRQEPSFSTPAALVEVSVSPPTLTHQPGSPFRLFLGDGRLLEIDTDFDAASLGRLLAVLTSR